MDMWRYIICDLWLGSCDKKKKNGVSLEIVWTFFGGLVGPEQRCRMTVKRGFVWLKNPRNNYIEYDGLAMSWIVYSYPKRKIQEWNSGLCNSFEI